MSSVLILLAAAFLAYPAFLDFRLKDHSTREEYDETNKKIRSSFLKGFALLAASAIMYFFGC